MNATTTNARKNVPNCWFLCEITRGLELDGYRLGHHVYASVTPDGRVFVLAKGGRRVTFKTAEAAALHLRRCRGRDGRAIRVANQDRQWCRWFEGRSAAA